MRHTNELSTTTLALLFGCLAALAGCDESLAATRIEDEASPAVRAPAHDAVERPVATAAVLPEDAPLSARRRELLELAFDAATAMPLMPHVKNRARAQEQVVETCLELDQPRLALAFLDQIPNWRRGAAYAALARWCARHGVDEPIEGYLARASEIADEVMRDEDGQEWRRDRIRVEIASTYAELGRTEDAARFASGVVDSEAGKVEAVEARFLDEKDLEARLADLERVVAIGNFELVRNALSAAVSLYDRFYDDVGRREQIERAIRAGQEKQPYAVRMELSRALADVALEHGDRVRALEHVAGARALLDAPGWAPEDRIALMAGLVEVTFRAGDEERARSLADAALALYGDERPKIFDVFRAGALRPVAEAYASAGDGATALAVYSRALEEGVLNPNSRPRAQDLAATACSMARNGVEPGEALWARMQEIRRAFSDPW